MNTAQFPALGTTAVVAVVDDSRLPAVREVVGRTISSFDLACSRFREDSELSALNAAAGTALEVSPLLIEAVSAALRAARLTDGNVDPTVGEALVALGYDRDFAELPARGTAATAAAASATATRARPTIAAVPGWRTIAVDPDAGTVRLPKGVTLDLGATAKALAADHAAERASAEAECGVLVSLGGDIAVAAKPPPEGWRVRVTDDHRSATDVPGQWITMRSGGLATSSTAVRRWQTAAGTAHHLVDPATGQPVSSVWRTVSVAAASCLDANIAATAAIIRGEPAIAWLESLRLPARLVGLDGTVRHIAGWPREGDDLA